MNISKLAKVLLSVVACLLVFIVFFGKTPGFLPDSSDFSTPPITQLAPDNHITLISHAGAGLPQGGYSNSLEALERGYADGLRVFEVDVHVTTDGHPVLLHGWKRDLQNWYTLTPAIWFKSYFSQGGPVMTKNEFDTARMKFGLTQLDLDGLANWIEQHPDVLVELNIKLDEKRVLADFAKTYPKLRAQIIAEVFNPADFNAVHELGYDKIVWVADGFDENTFLANAKALDLYAIALRADSPLIQLSAETGKSGVPVWAYTINSNEAAKFLSDVGVAGIYTDSLIHAEN